MRNDSESEGPGTNRGLLAVAFMAGIALFTAACATAPEPPIETVAYSVRASEADTAFGWYGWFPKRARDVRVHRVGIPGEWERGYRELPADVYYPPRFRYRRPEPAVIVVAGGVKWSSTVSLGAMLATEGVTAVVIDSLGAGQELQSAIEGVAAQGADLFIDTARLAIWSEGHAAPEALEALLDPGWHMHDAMQVGVFVSPVMFLGRGAGFDYGAGRMAPDVPVFIARAAGDDMYEVRASITRFMEAAEALDMDVRYVESPIGGHNWMIEETDPAATDVIREAVDFLEAHL